MAAPSDEYAFDLNIAKEAAKNFKARRKEREAKAKAISRGQYTKAETPDRVAKRMNRLLGLVKDEIANVSMLRPAAAPQLAAAPLSKEVHELMQLDPVTPEAVNDVAAERVIGETRDFLAIGFFERGVVASRAVSRIVTRLPDGRRSMGTGFMVTPSLLMTNWHVLKTAEDAASSRAEFNYQLSGTGATLAVDTFSLRPDLFFLNDQRLDFALVAIEPRSSTGTALSSYGFCPLIGAEGKILVQEPCNIVQHPKGELKQVVIRQNKVLDLPDKAPYDIFAHYEADTEPGSSGSPVFNDQWEVVALHHSSVPRTNAGGQVLDRNGKVWRNGDPDDIDWISNEGIRTSRLVAFIKAAAVKEHEKNLQAEFIAIGSGNMPPPPTAPVAASSPPTKPAVRPLRPRPRDTEADAAMGPPRRDTSRVTVERSGAPTPAAQPGSVSLTIPLTITIGVGGAHAAMAIGPAEPALAEAGAAVEAAIQPDPDYANRPGFDPNFLGFEAPLPGLDENARALVLPVDSDGVELKYYHYSVIMNAQRKLAFVSAVNLDAAAPFQVAREGGDRWFYDPRVDRDEQLGSRLYANNPLDRGHLTRRADAAWGDTEDEAQLANDDTFHWTNCSPQHEVFNQSTKANQRGLLLWGNLENHVAEQAAGGRVSIFNGPIFRRNDRLYREVRLPREFYKVIAYQRDNGQPGAVAFVLSQASLIKNLPAEEFEVGPYQPFQVGIADLEGRVGLDFGAIRGFDAMAAPGREAFGEEAAPGVLVLRGLRDVVL